VTLDEIADLAVLLAAKTSLGANCSNMQIRSALEFLKGRADISCGLNRPTESENNGDVSS
jgi:hypothetical protein